MSTETTDTVAVMAQMMSALSRLTTRGRIRKEMAAEGAKLSPTDLWLVDRLSEAGPARMSELATWQAVDRSTMTTQINRLLKAGLVHRTPHPEDRRSVVVSLTDAGRELQEESRAVARATFDSMLADWTPSEREQLTESLTHLVASMERHLTAAPEGHSTER